MARSVPPPTNSPARPKTGAQRETDSPSAPPVPHSEAFAEYERRLSDRQQEVARVSNVDTRLSLARGLVFVAGVGIAIVVLGNEALATGWLLLPVVVFVGLVLLHAQVVGQLTRARRAVDYYQTGLDRLNHRWHGIGATGDRYQDPSHVYTGDLDVFGNGSLFQLIATARTRLGEDRLAEWLSTPAEAGVIRKRQAAVEELKPSIDLREQFALLSAEVHDQLDQNRLLHWSQQPPQPVSSIDRVVVSLLSAASVVTLLAWLFFGTGASPFIFVLFLQVLLNFRVGPRLRKVAAQVDDVGSGLAILSQVLELMEAQRFQSPLLEQLLSSLNTEGRPPSQQIVRLNNRIQNLINSLHNQFFAPIAFLLGLPLHMVHAIERWRIDVGSHIPEWLQAVGEFEALSSMARYAYEHPDDPFPEIVGDRFCLEAEQIGHPLLPESECVRNDLSLGEETRLMLVSGSNMSGKSTLLRTVGTNTILALAGAPVRAKSLRLSPCQVGTAMRINDSLLDGKSLFYAVISRLKTVVELTKQPLPLLFLLDEILQGTNSHDRRVGAEGVIRTLVGERAMGLVTTHDLALTEIVNSLGDAAVNVHFEDHLEDGKMTFDYRLRLGVVRKSNALELMRMMGLQVPSE